MTDNKNYKKAVNTLSGFSTKNITPIKAWEYGEALNIIIESEEFKKDELRANLSEYLFDKYQIEIREETAHKYIKIFEVFDYQLLQDNPSLEMKRHIEYLLDNYSKDSEKILKVLKQLESQYANSSFFKKYKLKTIYAELDTSDLFTTIVNNYDEKQTENIAKNILSNLIKKAFNNKTNRPTKKQNKTSNNRQLQDNINIESHDLFKNVINKLHKFAPRDEQGLIGLFFTIYSFLSDEKNNFLFSLDNQYYRFSSVKLLQEKYPDATLIIDIVEKEKLGTRDILVEFEYNSKNFNDHGHIKEGPCDLIICWEHNWDDFVIPIISIKDTLKEGKIIVYTL